jgi:regulator of PEP synthase PpsR (kinase-PPPase family)
LKHFHIHLVSDSTGETVSSIARAAVAQFEGIDSYEHLWSLVRTKGQLEKVLIEIDKNPGMVLYTLVDPDLRDTLKAQCLKRSLPCIPVLAHVLAEISSYLGMQTSAVPGKQHELNDEYFSRVDAINYTLAHDDGQMTWELEEADIILVGPSRTSKSPTCVYLANKGFKAANVPFVMGCPLPENLETLTKPLMVGLIINPERLMQIRKTRLQSLNEERDTSYVDMDHIEAEVHEARKLFSKNKWPVIDVTRRSVEETAATIIQQFQKHYENKINPTQNHGTKP